jgi:hypothetical protein
VSAAASQTAPAAASQVAAGRQPASQLPPKRPAQQPNERSRLNQEFYGRTFQTGSSKSIQQKADVAAHLKALSLPYNDLVTYVKAAERWDACRAEPGKMRFQIHSARFASDTLQPTVVRLTRGGHMSSATASSCATCLTC